MARYESHLIQYRSQDRRIDWTLTIKNGLGKLELWQTVLVATTRFGGFANRRLPCDSFLVHL